MIPAFPMSIIIGGESPNISDHRVRMVGYDSVLVTKPMCRDASFGVFTRELPIPQAKHH